jgi:hypothetical protein
VTRGPFNRASGFPLDALLECVVLWEWDAERDRVVSTPNIHAIYGTASVDGVSHGMTLVHPDDLDTHQQTVHRAVERGRGYRSRFRIRRANDSAIVTIEERAEAVLCDAGTPNILIGFAIAVEGFPLGPTGERTAVPAALEEYCDVLLTTYATSLRNRPAASGRVDLGHWLTRATTELAGLRPMRVSTIAEASRIFAQARDSFLPLRRSSKTPG